MCDKEYPSRVAFTLLMKMQEDFMAVHAEAVWLNASQEVPFPALEAMIRKYQDPHEADAIMKIQRDLDDTKIILHKTIDSVLERGVKLDNLVEKSTDLSAQSKMYVALLNCSCAPATKAFTPRSVSVVRRHLLTQLRFSWSHLDLHCTSASFSVRVQVLQGKPWPPFLCVFASQSTAARPQTLTSLCIWVHLQTAKKQNSCCGMM